MNYRLSNLLPAKQILLTSFLIVSLVMKLSAQEQPKEDDYFKIVPVLSPQTAMLEVGGLAMMPNGNVALCTRRGDLYIVENPTSDKPYFHKYASGLHEP